MDQQSHTGPQVVITGGQGDLAQALAADLENAGLAVASPGRDELDVTCSANISAYFAGLEPDLLVCNAGIARDTLIARTAEQAWDDIVGVNLRGAAMCARAAIGGMMRRRRGHIVFISSFSAVSPPTGQCAYAAAKAGLHGLAKSLAREAGSRGVRANVIMPGYLDTKMTAPVSEERRAAVINDHALGELNRPAHVAAFLTNLHLHLPATSGQVFNLDSRIST